MPEVDNNKKLVNDAEALLADVKSYSGDRAARMALMRKLELMYLDLEDPQDSMNRQWSFMNTASSLNVMVETGTFEQMPTESGSSISATDLALKAKLDPTVIIRLMRILVANGIIEETGEDTFAHTAKSLLYLEGAEVDYWKLCINMMASYLKFPDYLKTRSAEDMFDLRKTPYAVAYGKEGLTFYEVLTETRERFMMFNKAMMQQEAQLPTLGMYSFISMEEQVKAEPERAFIVDVGGGRGQSLLAIGKETGGAYGAKMILQDRPQVLDSISDADLPGIEKMSYDFYTPQPVQNAHIYFIRRIMHNYQDPVCIRILSIVAEAMGSTSRLLIGEAIIPEQTSVAGDSSAYWMDAVMVQIGGKERSRKDFIKILEPAGLELVKVWPAASGHQAIIEARLKST